jgi:hypothetical protein
MESVYTCILPVFLKLNLLFFNISGQDSLFVPNIFGPSAASIWKNMGVITLVTHIMSYDTLTSQFLVLVSCLMTI